MTDHIQQAEELIAQMTSAEKAKLLQRVVQDLSASYPGIESTPGICGCEACIVRTRIPVWLLVRARQLGTTEAELLHAYPTLNAEDLTNAWASYRGNKAEIESQIKENEAA